MSFTRISLDARSTIIVSGMDYFIDDARTEKERTALMGRMIGVLKKLHQEKESGIIRGCRTAGMRERVCLFFDKVQVWNENGAINQTTASPFRNTAEISLRPSWIFNRFTYASSPFI